MNMRSDWVVLGAAFGYLALLFLVAAWGDRRAEQGRSLLNSPTVYALSIAVYCTAWTFYGSVGRAAQFGPSFLLIYLGPTLAMLLAPFTLRKMVRIAARQRITSIADFISARYGKSSLLGALVAVMALITITPYIALQLKAITVSHAVLMNYPLGADTTLEHERFWMDRSFWIAIVLALFIILFGTRHLDASERHEGMVAAIAVESLVKLVAFLAVGIFVTFLLFEGPGALLAAAAEAPALITSMHLENVPGGATGWVGMLMLAFLAFFTLPRQFQVLVVESVDEQHLERASWLFPLYLLLINLFVIPIALAGVLLGESDPDSFVLTLPLSAGLEGLPLLVFIGGLSAATGMVIVAAIALSTMICNDLIMPALLRLTWLRLTERGDLSVLLLRIRRFAIVLILLLSFAYFRFIGQPEALVTIGLVSFAAAAQFAPAIIGGIFWKGGSRLGALTGLTLGFVTWAYTLLLPSFARPGWLPTSFIEQGPFGVELLRPYALLGLQGLDSLSHAMFWSMLANIGGYVVVSLLARQSAIERIQAVLFVDVFRHSGVQSGSHFWRGSATVPDLKNLVARFIGPARAERAFSDYGRIHGLNVTKLREADPGLVSFTERLLAGAIGAASARVMVASVAKGEVLGIEEVMEILEETSQVIEYSHGLEQKSRELEALTAELREANERLQELDRMKDEFLSTVSHELRTPLTSIRSFSEILFDNPDLGVGDRRKFLTVIVKESERLTRLINQILDLAKMEAGSIDWEMETLDPRPVIEEAIAVTSALFAEKSARLEVQIARDLPVIHADRDRLIQVLVNLLSNAAKFCDEKAGYVTVAADSRPEGLRISVADNGRGVPAENRQLIFEKFQQASANLTDKPRGTGLGLTISRQIIEHFGGRIWVEPAAGASGARFCLVLPRRAAQQAREAV